MEMNKVMPIRFAIPEDRKVIQSLFEMCFPEDPLFNRWFFKEYFKIENTLLYLENDKIVAMLQMYPLKLKMNQFVYPVHYLFGVCTHPNHRKKGYMEKILEYACHLGREKGDIASVLIPQEKWLFNLYRKYGYEPKFTTSVMKMEVESMAINAVVEEVTVKNLEEVIRLYEMNMNEQMSYILRTKEYWLLQKAMFQATEGKIYSLKRQNKYIAYGFIWIYENELWIQEGFGMSQEALILLANAVAQKENKKYMTITTAFIKNRDPVPLGCIKFLQNEIKSDISGYMNLMFN